jgi:hypothetical protein
MQKGLIGIEEFRKFKLGKGELSSYATEVRDLLKQCNTYESGDEDIVKFPRYLTVRKERHVDQRHGLKHEVCRIAVSDDASTTVAENFRCWFSITLEESVMSADILGRILLVYPPGHVIWTLLDCFIALNDELIAENASSFTERQHLYCPIIRGYPGFIGIISGNSKPEDLAANLDICREVAAFRQNIKEIASDTITAIPSAAAVVITAPSEDCC